MTAVWVVGGLVAAIIVYMRGFTVGHRLGYRLGRLNVDRDWQAQINELTDEWRQLFIDLGIDHGAELAQVQDQLAKADRTLADLHRQIPVVFEAGQVFQAERKDAGL